MHQSIFGKTLVLVALGVLAVDTAQAFNFGNMMNPSRWWGGDNDRHDDYYGAPPYGYGYPAPGYAAPGYAVPAYTAPAYTTPGYGYAAPGYAAPAVTAPAPAARAPAPAAATSAGDDEAEIARLKQRLNELEAAGAAQAPPAPHPYERDYRFPEAAQGGGNSAAAAAPAAAPAASKYPVYSPFGPPADFPPMAPDDEVTPSQVEAVPVPPVTASPAPVADTDATPSDGPVTFSPYGNPANYVPPVQEMGQRVYEFGK
jgi:hypothetical protein